MTVSAPFGIVEQQATLGGHRAWSPFTSYQMQHSQSSTRCPNDFKVGLCVIIQDDLHKLGLGSRSEALLFSCPIGVDEAQLFPGTTFSPSAKK